MRRSLFVKKHSPGFLELVNAANARITELNADQIVSRIRAGESVCLIDVREESEFAAGHAAGAIWMGKGIIERDMEKRFPDKDAEYVLYCGGGFRSALAADALRLMGYTRVISMDGGWRGWKACGGDVTR